LGRRGFVEAHVRGVDGGGRGRGGGGRRTQAHMQVGMYRVVCLEIDFRETGKRRKIKKIRIL
jgi:hypothetical protein